jgi:hypothetical protein
LGPFFKPVFLLGSVAVTGVGGCAGTGANAHFTQEFIPLQIAVVTGTGALLGFFAEQLGFQVLHPQFQPPDLRLLLRHLGGQIFGSDLSKRPRSW